MAALLMVAFLLGSLPCLHCLSPDEVSFSLTYHGGKIMTRPVSVSLLWFGEGWNESGQEAIRNAITSLTPTRYPSKDLEVPTLGDWWEIIRQYRDSSNTPVTDKVDVGAECFYTGSPSNLTLNQIVEIISSVFNRTSIDGQGGNLSCREAFEVNENTIYHVIFSQSVRFLDAQEQRELIDMCSGSFDRVKVVKGVMVKMVWARAPQNVDDQCSSIFHGDSYLGPPNGNEMIDSLVGSTLAKIAEEVTNRDGRGWSTSDGSGMSVSSACGSLLMKGVGASPLFRDEQRNVSFNVVGLKGYRYMAQHVWDQQIRNCAFKLSERCGTAAVILTQPKGYLSTGISVNHTDGLQPYPSNQNCKWIIDYPTAEFITFTLKYLSFAADSNDYVTICKPAASLKGCYTIQSVSRNSGETFKLMGSRAYVEFISGDQVSTVSRGWELSYSAGLCNGKKNIYDHSGVISYTTPKGFSYVEGLSCQWVLHGKSGTRVSLSFTHINTSKDVDFLAIYNSTEQEMANQVRNFSGLYSGPNLPQINLTGQVVVVFSTQTDKGTGWSANFYISSPISRRESPLLITTIVSASVLTGFSAAFTILALLRRRRKLRSKNEKLKFINVDVSKEENHIAEGPSAIVYRAVLRNGSAAAVKIHKERMSATQLEEEILLKACSHPNIISLMGFTKDGTGRRHLVFEFMGRGTLGSNLRERAETLSWEKRLDIASKISSALQLLHMYLKPPVYHGNLTSENILLEESWNAKLGGFGRANYCKNDGVCPDKQLEMQEDIRRFGLLLLELLKGEAVMNENILDCPELFNEENEILGAQGWLDPRLEIPQDESKIKGLAKLGDIAKWCISNSHGVGVEEHGPKIGDVVLSIKQVKQLFCSTPI